MSSLVFFFSNASFFSSLMQTGQPTIDDDVHMPLFPMRCQTCAKPVNGPAQAFWKTWKHHPLSQPQRHPALMEGKIQPKPTNNCSCQRSTANKTESKIIPMTEEKKQDVIRRSLRCCSCAVFLTEQDILPVFDGSMNMDYLRLPKIFDKGSSRFVLYDFVFCRKTSCLAEFAYGRPIQGNPKQMICRINDMLQTRYHLPPAPYYGGASALKVFSSDQKGVSFNLLQKMEQSFPQVLLKIARYPDYVPTHPTRYDRFLFDGLGLEDCSFESLPDGLQKKVRAPGVTGSEADEDFIPYKFHENPDVSYMPDHLRASLIDLTLACNRPK